MLGLIIGQPFSVQHDYMEGTAWAKKKKKNVPQETEFESFVPESELISLKNCIKNVKK